MILRATLSLILGILPLAAQAVELTLPGSARQTVGDDLGVDSYALPIAPFDGTAIPSRAFEGFVTQQVWRVEGGGVTPLQIMQPLREELKESEYTSLFECSDRDCGGFDFRFGTQVVSAPDMYVDLDDYRFLSAIKGDTDAPQTAISLLISRSSEAAYIQIIQVAVEKSTSVSVAKGDEIIASTPDQSRANPTLGPADIEKQLDIAGHIILSDLTFKTGSSDLGQGPFASLEKIATYLRRNSERRIALVGHTDAEGSLEGNIALSKRRAESVRSRLIDAYDITSAQLSAQGVGFLAPVASNLSKAGRDANRRVEAVLISTK